VIKSMKVERKTSEMVAVRVKRACLDSVRFSCSYRDHWETFEQEEFSHMRFFIDHNIRMGFYTHDEGFSAPPEH